MYIILRADITTVFAEYLTAREQPELMSATFLDNLLQIIGQQVKDFCVKVLSHLGSLIAAFIGPILIHGSFLRKNILESKKNLVFLINIDSGNSDSHFLAVFKND